MTRDPLRLAFERDPGTLAHAKRLLEWIVGNEGDDPEFIELKHQAAEVARSLHKLDQAAKRGRPRLRPLIDTLSPRARRLAKRLTR